MKLGTGPLSRRCFLHAATVTGVAHFLPLAAGAAALALVSPQVLQPLPLGAIRPAGWLRNQLLIQANGLSGHLDKTWPDVGSDSGWLGGNGEKFERGPYWLDGLVGLAYLLADERLKRKVQPWIEWTLKSQRADGNFGPVTAENDWWPRMVMLKVLLQYEEATGDTRVLPFMQRYFAYQRTALPAQPLESWAKYRWQDNVLTVLWLYDRQPDPALLELAHLLRVQGYDWRRQFADFKYTSKTDPAIAKAKSAGYHETHGVDIGMGLKSAAVWSRISHDPADRNSPLQMLDMLDRYHGLPNGMYSASEHLAGRSPSQGTELCTVVEVMYSLEQAIAVTGDARLADRLEVIAFNALPGTISDDMWSHQYDQQPNQIECTKVKRPWDNGPEANLFGLAPNYGCCTANFSQGWPKLTSSLWMRSADGGLAAVVYAPCSVSTEVRGTRVGLEVRTEYPFRDTVEIHVSPETGSRFPLHLRVPHGAPVTATVNGRQQASQPVDGYLTIRRLWKPGDVVHLSFALQPVRVAGVDRTVSIRRGALVLVAPIGEQWNKLANHGLAADWEVLGISPWNYGLVDGDHWTTTQHRVSSVPFALGEAPLTLEVNAVLLPGWQRVGGNAADLPFAVESGPQGKPTRLTLVPYASTKLRITAFPVG